MKDRLTKRDEYGNADIIGCESELLCGDLDFKQMNCLTKALNRLAEYEDLEEQGLIVRLPYKLGDKVYHIYNNGITSDKKQKYKIYEETVFGYEIDSDKLGWRIRLNGGTPTLSIIGDRVFSTRAEAEKKLKELKGEE